MKGLFPRYVLLAALIALSACQPVFPPSSTALPLASPTGAPSAAPAGTPADPTAAPTEPPGAPTAAPTSAAAGTPSGFPAPDGSLQLALAAQHGGLVLAAAVTADARTAFLAFGPNLLPLDVSDPAAIQVIGGPFPLNTLAVDLALQDGLLYLIDRQEHLFVLGVSDPETMYVVQAFKGAGSARIFLAGEWGFVSSDACREGQCTSTLKMFALAGLDETPPELGPEDVGPRLPVAAALEVPGSVQEVTADGQYVYIAHQNGLLVAGLPGLEPLAEHRRNWVSGAAFDLPHAYLAGNSFTVLDLANPLNPRAVPVSQEVFVSDPMAISGDRLYGFSTFGEFGLCWSDMFGLEISDPAALEIAFEALGGFNLSCPSKMEAAGSRLFVIDWDGLAVIELSDPDRPELAGRYANLPVMLDAIRQGIIYSGSDRDQRSLWVHDARSPQDVRSYGPFEPRWVTSPVVWGDFLYAPVWQDGLAVIDLSDPFEPAVAAQVSAEQLVGPGLDASLQGNYLYTAREENGVGVFDVTNPASPVLVGEFQPPAAGSDWARTSEVTTGGDFAVSLEDLFEGSQRTGQLRLLSLQDPTRPQDAGAIAVGRAFTSADLENDGRLVFALAGGCSEAGTCSHRILIVDPAAGEALAALDLPGEAFDLLVDGGYLYVAAGTAGLSVWNVSDPANPVLAAQVQVGSPHTPIRVERVLVEGEWVYLSNPEAGLYVYQQDR